MSLYIGLMSGTSMDGIDAALVDTAEHKLIAGVTCPYSEAVKQMLDAVVTQRDLSLMTLCHLNAIIGKEFAQAVHQLMQASEQPFSNVTGIGSHGQTVAHDAFATPPYTLQLGCAHTISEHTGLPVVADFRTRDMVLGGQGAPFAPVYHQALFGSKKQDLAVVNLGGIANVTFFKPGMIGFDTGPGNCLMDAWIKKNLNQTYDVSGEWAASGQVIPELLVQLLGDHYFKRAAPKSIGKEYFSLDWLGSNLKNSYRPEDVQATLMALTVETIAQAIMDVDRDVTRLVLCGGGAHNTALAEALQQRCTSQQVQSSAVFNLDPDYIEAMMFAWLAEKTLNRIPVDLSSITGAKKQAVLGAIYYPSIDKTS